ncbi:MAG: methyltransferase domain-containing protein, partial [Patescibacteria group bacterium]
VLKAQSMMMVKKIGRLPVVDGKGNLVGILSKSDIFKAVVGEKLPFEKDEKYHDWLSRRYDTMVDWKTRLENEIPDLVSLFKKENVKNILDVGCGTGMHVIALAKEGFHAVGIDRSSGVIQAASKNTKALSDHLKQRVKFIHTEYKNLEQILEGTSFDAAISMGSGLAHTSDPLPVLREVNNVMNKKAVFVCQISNQEKIINVDKRLYDFAIRKSPYPEEGEKAFLRFYDPKEEGVLTLNISVFSRWKKKWVFRGMNLVPLIPLDKESITSLFKKIGFSKLAYYGGEKGHYYDYLFRKSFKPTQSDVLVVVAKR